MVSTATFIRHTPQKLLLAYFERHGLSSLLKHSDRLAPDSASVIDDLPEPKRTHLLNDFERIAAMADEGGETALYGVSKAHDALDDQPNGYGRALWVFLQDQEEFRRAEEVRYTDEHRRGRMWDGFIGDPGLLVRPASEALEAFKAAVREHFRTANVEVDVYERQRPAFEGTDAKLVQVTIYSEGRLNDILQFREGKIDRAPLYPVIEAALTYEASTGAIEVVANNRATREDYVRLFAEKLLGTQLTGKQLPLRRYDLAILAKRHRFPSDPADRIHSVRLVHLRLMPLDTVGERLALECKHKDGTSIWDMAETRFGSNNPLLGGWTITQAKLVIDFQRQLGSRRGRTLPVTITVPHKCDLKDRTEQERVIAEKYLRSWQIVRDA